MLHQYQASPALNLSGFQEQISVETIEKTIESNLHLQEPETHTQFFVCDHQTKGLKELKKTDNGTWHLSIFTPCLLQLLPKIEGACLLRFPRWGQLGGNEITFKIRHATLNRPNPSFVIVTCWYAKSILRESSSLKCFFAIFSWFLLARFVWVFLVWNNFDEMRNLH